MKQTFQTRIYEYESYLTTYAALFNTVERRLFVDHFIHGHSLTDLKKRYLRLYDITARQFNSVSHQLKGKIASVKEVQKNREADLAGKIKSIQTWIDRHEKKKEKIHKQLLSSSPTDKRFLHLVKQYRNIKFKLHQKKRKRRNIQQKLEKLKADHRQGKTSICFGSRSLFRKQFHLEANGYDSHESWLKDWRKYRNSQFMVVGSKDETFGNQNCTYDLTNSLRLRVTNGLEGTYGKFIVFPDVHFPYGQDVLDKAKCSTYRFDKKGKKVKLFQAITYRFVRKDKGWYLYATTEREGEEIVTDEQNGCLGIDLNAGFLTLGSVDRYGNPLAEAHYPVRMSDRSKEQVEAELSEQLDRVIDEAFKQHKPIAIENLDFTKKKQRMGEQSRKHNRMLSGFLYAKFKQLLMAKAHRKGVEVIEVNPFATSLVGHFRFMSRYGLSSHGSASVTIARRGLRLKLESPNYESLIGFPKTFNKHASNYKKWGSIGRALKHKTAPSFQHRMALLKAMG